MRVFIAIELPQDIKERLSRLQDKLKGSGADVRWVNPGNIHLTLRFLGEINEESLGKVDGMIREVAKGKPKIKVNLSGLGLFPDTNHPKVIWAGVKEGDSEIKIIAKEIEEKLLGLGIPKEERPFSSHITIGRVKSSVNKERLLEGLDRLEGEFREKGFDFAADKITIFKSSLLCGGPVYEALKEITLKDT